MSNLTCSRCHQQRPAVEEVPYSGELGEQIRRQICGQCWSEWEQAEVIVINELRLDFMDPKSHDILLQNLREFLGLEIERPPAT